MPESPARGLNSLLSASRPSQTEPGREQQSRVLDIPIQAIIPNPRQHRRTFDNEALASLADSIREHGLLQPIVVRPSGTVFELIAGERRWRAAKLAGLETIRAVSKPSSESSSLILSVIENLQREDLDPIEEASAYKALVDLNDITHEQVASYVGKDRATISNTLRLLELPSSIQAKLVSGAITPGHARVLLAVSDPAKRQELADRVVTESLSVRQLEQQVYGTPRTGATPAAGTSKAKPAHLASLEQKLSERLGVPVAIHESRRGGRMVLRFKSNQEFLRILEALGIESAEL